MGTELTPSEIERECEVHFAFLKSYYGFKRRDLDNRYAYSLVNSELELLVKGEDWGTYIVCSLWRCDLHGPASFIYVNTLIRHFAPEMWIKFPCRYTDTFTPKDSISYYASGLQKAGGAILCGDFGMWNLLKNEEGDGAEDGVRLGLP